MNTQNPISLLQVHLEIPGLQLDVPAGMRLAELVLSPIELSLASAQLLATSEPPRQIKQAALDAALTLGKLMEGVQEKRVMAADLSKFLAVPDKVGAILDGSIEAAGLSILDILKGLRSGRGIAAVALDNWLLLALEVSDLASAGTILFVELERLGLLAFCEVAAFDQASNSFRTVFPLNCDKPFERHWILARQVFAERVEKTAGIVKDLHGGTET